MNDCLHVRMCGRLICDVRFCCTSVCDFLNARSPSSTQLRSTLLCASETTVHVQQYTLVPNVDENHPDTFGILSINITPLPAVRLLFSLCYSFFLSRSIRRVCWLCVVRKLWFSQHITHVADNENTDNRIAAVAAQVKANFRSIPRTNQPDGVGVQTRNRPRYRYTLVRPNKLVQECGMRSIFVCIDYGVPFESVQIVCCSNGAESVYYNFSM